MFFLSSFLAFYYLSTRRKILDKENHKIRSDLDNQWFDSVLLVILAGTPS